MVICGHELPPRLVDALTTGEWPGRYNLPNAWRALGVEDPAGFLLLSREQMEQQTEALARHASHRAAELLGLATTRREGFINVQRAVAIAAGVNDELWVHSYEEGDSPVVLGSISTARGSIRFRYIADSFADLLTKMNES